MPRSSAAEDGRRHRLGDNRLAVAIGVLRVDVAAHEEAHQLDTSFSLTCSPTLTDAAPQVQS
jgi:hypothetical protein